MQEQSSPDTPKKRTSYLPPIGLLLLALLVVTGGFVAAVPINVTAGTGTSPSDVDMDATSNDRVIGFTADSGVSTTKVNDSEIFRKVETNGSSFVVHVDLSLFTSLFAQGEELRLVTGGTVDGQRVVWFDIGITRTIDGFRTRADLSMNLPF